MSKYLSRFQWEGLARFIADNTRVWKLQSRKFSTQTSTKNSWRNSAMSFQCCQNTDIRRLSCWLAQSPFLRLYASSWSMSRMEHFMICCTRRKFSFRKNRRKTSSSNFCQCFRTCTTMESFIEISNPTMSWSTISMLKFAISDWRGIRYVFIIFLVWTKLRTHAVLWYTNLHGPVTVLEKSLWLVCWYLCFRNIILWTLHGRGSFGRTWSWGHQGQSAEKFWPTFQDWTKKVYSLNK